MLQHCAEIRAGSGGGCGGHRGRSAGAPNYSEVPHAPGSLFHVSPESPVTDCLSGRQQACHQFTLHFALLSWEGRPNLIFKWRNFKTADVPLMEIRDGMCVFCSVKNNRALYFLTFWLPKYITKRVLAGRGGEQLLFFIFIFKYSIPELCSKSGAHSPAGEDSISKAVLPQDTVAMTWKQAAGCTPKWRPL